MTNARRRWEILSWILSRAEGLRDFRFRSMSVKAPGSLDAIMARVSMANWHTFGLFSSLVRLQIVRNF